MSNPGAAAGGNRPVALQLYTLRDELAADRPALLRRLAGFGYRAVEPYDVLTDPDTLRAELDAAGLAVCSVHTQPFGDGAEAARPASRYASGVYPDHAVYCGTKFFVRTPRRNSFFNRRAFRCGRDGMKRKPRRPWRNTSTPAMERTSRSAYTPRAFWVAILPWCFTAAAMLR